MVEKVIKVKIKMINKLKITSQIALAVVLVFGFISPSLAQVGVDSEIVALKSEISDLRTQFDVI